MFLCTVYNCRKEKVDYARSSQRVRRETVAFI